jgi:hypothetical protein
MKTIKSTRVQYLELLVAYYDLRSEILDHTEEYHDSMYCDYSGYADQYAAGDYDEIDDLRNQVEAFELMLKALCKINYKFC